MVARLPAMDLRYLDFDDSEDADGHGCFEAMASTTASHVAAVRSEVAHVLAWAWAQFPQGPASLDEGGEWDYQLDAQQEWSANEALVYDPGTGQFSSVLGPPGVPRHTVTLSLVGRSAFCQAFRTQFAQG